MHMSDTCLDYSACLALCQVVTVELSALSRGRFIMPPPNGLEAYMFHACPFVCPSVCLSVRLWHFSVAITNEPLDGSSWNCNIFYTLKWRAELFFQGRAIQDADNLYIFICKNFKRKVFQILLNKLKSLQLRVTVDKCKYCGLWLP